MIRNQWLNLARSNVTWQRDATQLQAIRHDINATGRIIADLNAAHTKASLLAANGNRSDPIHIYRIGQQHRSDNQDANRSSRASQHEAVSGLCAGEFRDGHGFEISDCRFRRLTATLRRKRSGLPESSKLTDVTAPYGTRYHIRSRTKDQAESANSA